MAKHPSFWNRLSVFSWLRSKQESRPRKVRKRNRVARRVPFESLEERDLLTVVVNLTTTSIFPDVPAIIIHGSGFDPIVSNNTVAFNDGATGTVTSATDTELTVEFSTPPIEAGILSAIVTTATENSGSAVQVATVVPVVTTSAGNLPANATTLTIGGSGFDTTAGNNTVVLSNGAVGTVSAATADLLTVTLSTGPTDAGTLTVVVTTNSVSSGGAVQVATVIPVVTSSTASLAADATTLTIVGFGFSTTAANNTVDFDGKAVGTVTSATATSLTISLSTPPKVAGILFALVTTNGIRNAGPVQVASVKPVVSNATSNLLANATTLTINGFGFDKIAGNNSVVFNYGAVGTVTAATANTLSVTFSTKPISAGSLTVVVTSNGVSSGTAVQAATVIPVVTSRTINLAANAASVTISGFGFDTTAGNNTLIFNNSAVGSVTTATATSLIVTFSTKPTSAGSLTAVVTTNSSSSGAAVQVATVTPVVTSNTSNVAANATTITMNGFGFDITAGNNTVVFNNGAVGTVSTATANLLTVTFSTKPTTAGTLTAIVTTNSVGSGAASQIATVTPVVTSSTTNLSANASNLNIRGFGFSAVLANNIVIFNNGAVGSVTAASPTSLTISFSTKPTTAGNLTAVMTTNGANSGSALQVATVIPYVTNATSNLSADATTLTINGFGFDTTIGNNTVVLKGDAVGTVTTASAISLIVTLTTRPTTAGTLTAIVTTNGLSNGSAVQVATVTPVVIGTTSNFVAANASFLTIDGFGFATTPGNNLVTFDDGVVRSVTAATAFQLTVSLTGNTTSAGALSAVVSTNGIASGSPIQVATVIPVVTSSTASLAANARTLVIRGFGFDTTAGDNTVSFNDGAVGIVTAATPTSLNVTFSTDPVVAGTLTAVVTTDLLDSGSAVQVANVTPVVTSNASSIIAANATSVTITGYGFDSTIGNNSVTLDGGAVGAITASSPTSLTVSFSTKPTKAGLLSATVTTNTHSSGSVVPVAAVAPVVLANSASIQAANASTVVIVGVGFDTTAANNTVVFESGAVGTVSTATASALTVSLTTKPPAGSLYAAVTTNGIGNGSTVQVATVRPIVTSSTNSFAADAATITIAGFGFDTTGSNNTVIFNNGAVGTVTAATSNELTVAFSAKPISAGNLTAIITANGVSSVTAIQVGTVVPVVTSGTAILLPNASSLTIDGFGFDSIASRNTVTFNNGAIGTVTASSPTSLTVAFSKKPRTAGSLTAIVTTNSISSGSVVQVASVAPLVLPNSSYQLGANATSLSINGLGFDTIASNNTVAFDNGAVGTVTAATETSLSVSISTPPTAAGRLNAIVTTNSLSSGSAVQVAVFSPVVTSSTSDLAATATELTINGFGFDATFGNNTVVFSDGAVGMVTAATATMLTVAFTTLPANADILMGVVTTNGVSSGEAVQVATVKPLITSSTASLNVNATSIIINGFGFSTSVEDNSVTFNSGAVGTVTAATTTALTVTFSTNATSVGNLTAIVTTNTQSSGSAVQVANVIPVVSINSEPLAADASTLTIDGFGFDSMASNNSVSFNNGAIGTVTTATTTSLTVTFSTKPSAAGNLSAMVTTNSISSGAAVQVATVKPVVTSSTENLSANAATLTINGFGFSTTAGNNTVLFDNGAVGTVTAATATVLTVTFGIKPTSAGSLTAVVTTNSLSSGPALQVATVTPLPTTNTSSLAANASLITISGFGFDTTASRNTIVFNNSAVGVVSAATATSLTVTLTTKPRAGGSLTAVTTTNGVSSGSAVQVATVIPVVISNSAFQLNANTSTLTINGSGFDTTAGNNTVTFNNGAVGTVSSSTASVLTVTFSTKPTSAGSLTAIVNTNNASSGLAVQVATVAPVVTNTTANLAADASTVTINGFGFSTIAGNNTVVLSNGAVGTVTSATANAIIVTFSTKPISVGNLTAILTSNSIFTGAAVQIATVTPVVTSSTSSLAINASTMIISGFGFDTTASRNTVVFNNGAIGIVTTATVNSLTVAFAVKPAAVGSLTAVVTTSSLSSGAALQVANVIGIATSSTANRGADGTTLSINGFGFDTLASNNAVIFSGGAVGTVTAASATMLTVTVSTKPRAGNLMATVVINGVSTGSPVQVATVRPVLTRSIANLTANATTLTISGFGFDTTPGNNTVAFNLGAAGTVTAATATTLTVIFSTNATSVGSLSAVVTTNGVSSGTALQIAKVVPVVTTSMANLALTSTTMTINGFGFDATPNSNTVVFNNDAVGTVTAATATALTVTFSTAPTAGNLTAVVTRNGVSSGIAVQVALMKPVVTASTTILSADLTTLLIAGTGFSTTAGNNAVAFNNGAVGTVSAATSTSLTVTFSTKPIAGPLTASVTTNGVSSDNATQVAAINPVVTTGAVNLAINGTRFVISGFGFSPVIANNTIVFNGGAVGTVTAATVTSLSISLSTKPTAAGFLTAVVTTNVRTSGTAVQVAQVVAAISVPSVTASTAGLAATAATLTIAGTGFNTTAANNIVTFNNGAIGTVSTATETSLTIVFSTKPKAGNLTAIVSSSGVLNGAAVQVASVTPVVIASNANQAAGAATLTISGFGFDTTPGNNSVSLSNGAAGNVTAATATTLTVSLSTRPTSVGELTASVTTNTKSSGPALQVARVTPSVSNNATPIAINSSSLAIGGFAFDPIAANNTVVFNNGAIGTVIAATATSLTVTFGTKPTAVGNLTAVVTTNSISSGAAIQVATVKPFVISSTSNLAASEATINIDGVGFDTTATNNSVAFSSGAVGTVTSATATGLTVTFSTKPSAGNLTAIVTTNSVTSGTVTQVATVNPVVTSSTANLPASASTITLSGFGFDTTPSHHTVTFNNGAVGTVTASTATILTVTFSSKPRSAGSLTAVVVSNSMSSGTAVQTATVIPVVTSNSSNQNVNANTVLINGFGFDLTAANNTVAFNNGAVGIVTTAAATLLTVAFATKPTTLGNLTAVITTNSVSSGTAVQVATVRSVVTSSTANLPLTANTMTINGFGFDTTAANNTVAFNNGAVGTVSSATATALTITFTARPSAGTLTAVVTANGVNNGNAVPVATLVPVITVSTLSQAANSTTVTIVGLGFDITASRNTVVFNNGALGTVTSATATSLTVTFTTKPNSAGSLTAVVTVNGIASGTTAQVASVNPVVTVSTSNLAINALSIVINGFGFDPIASRNTVVFNNGALGTVTAATATSLTVNLGTKPNALGGLTAVVTTNSIASGTAVQVATVIPSVTVSTAAITSAATTMTIRGFGFSTTAGNNTVVFNNGAVGTVTAATATTLTVTFSTKPSAGNLTAVVTANGVSSGPAIQVATLAPAVTFSTANLATTANTIAIAGTGFDTTASLNTVVFNNGAVGTVTSATATSLSVTLSTRPTAGNLTAVVTTNGVNSGSAIQVAAVKPLVTSSTSNLARTASTVLINGFGFNPVAGGNTVVFNNGAVGTVTSATATVLIVTFSTKPVSTGSLTAVITTSGTSSGTAVQVANMT